MATRELRLGTRGSQLALWQARTVAARIADAGGPPCRLVIIKTSGDRLQEAPLSEIGGKRLFVKEIEDALQRDEIDLAVHSSKDMPADPVAGLTVAATLPREDPRDAVVLPAHGPGARPVETVETLDALVAALGAEPTIGTGSIRRIAQLRRLFPRARFAPIRGNLDTRLRKLDEGQHDALVLAAAGLRRLGFDARITLALPPEGCLPAPGQGIVAVEIRQDDRLTRDAVRRIDDANATVALAAERELVTALGGGCQTPIAALAVPNGAGLLELTAAVIAPDGSRIVRSVEQGPVKGVEDAREIGSRAAERLRAQGADEILAEVRRTTTATRGPAGPPAID